MQNETVRRAIRTLIQLVAGGGLAALTDQLAKDLPTVYVPYLVIGYTLLVTLAQNALEDVEKIPRLLKDPPRKG